MLAAIHPRGYANQGGKRLRKVGVVPKAAMLGDLVYIQIRVLQHQLSLPHHIEAYELGRGMSCKDFHERDQLGGGK